MLLAMRLAQRVGQWRMCSMLATRSGLRMSTYFVRVRLSDCQTVRCQTRTDLACVCFLPDTLKCQYLSVCIVHLQAIQGGGVVKKPQV